YTLTLKVKYSDYRQITRNHTHPHPLRDSATLTHWGQALLHQHVEPTAQVRLLGLTLSNLEPLPATVEFVQLALPLELPHRPAVSG
ncbi:MAG TPA: hypothetical protein V6D02_15105, partial [Candidatus Obscuribacterales bacterium]